MSADPGAAAPLPLALLPAGVVVAFAGNTANVPAGWLLCDGTAYSRLRFVALFNCLGTIYGGDPADPANTFCVPDYGGRFLRSVDCGQMQRDNGGPRGLPSPTSPNNYPSANVGSIQSEGIGEHSHTTNALGFDVSGGGNHASGFNAGPGHGDGSYPTNPIGGRETRPVNIYVYYIISTALGSAVGG